MYSDAAGRYLIEARRHYRVRLFGRYGNIPDENDSGPYVGKISRANDRIDGFWSGGHWDLRRAAKRP